MRKRLEKFIQNVSMGDQIFHNRPTSDRLGTMLGNGKFCPATMYGNISFDHRPFHTVQIRGFR